MYRKKNRLFARTIDKISILLFNNNCNELSNFSMIIIVVIGAKKREFLSELQLDKQILFEFF